MNVTTSGAPLGSLIVFEGPDGAGKTTIAGSYAAHLRTRGKAVSTLSFPGREANSLGHLVYQIHHNPAAYGIAALTSESLQALHLAAHLDSIDRFIRPRILRGETVVLDRYWWSMWVYGMDGGAAKTTIDALVECERQHWGALTPTVVILVTRRDSLRPEDAGPDWARRQSLYEEVADHERLQYPVRVISNDSKASETLARVEAAVEDVGLAPVRLSQRLRTK